MITTLSAIVFIVLVGITIIFQLCLASGLPWGAASMGGKFPGKYPQKMRFVAVLNSFVLAFLIIIVLSRSGIAFQSLFIFSKVAIWFLIVFFIGGTIMNLITPSRIEKIWAPVTFFQCISCIIIALN